MENYLDRTKAHYQEFPLDADVGSAEEAAVEEIELSQKLCGEVITSGVIQPGTRVVDIGGGGGRIADLVKRKTGAKAMVADISFSQTRSAKKRGVPAVQADALRLPFRDHVFDFVIAYGSLHHTPSCHLGLAEAVRVGTPKSRIFFSVYNRHHIYFWLYHSLGEFCQKRWNSGRPFMVYLVFRLWFIPMLWMFRCLQQRAIARFSTYWIWKSRNLQGNAIDFLVLVENMSFAQAMEILCPKNTPATGEGSCPRTTAHENRPSTS